MAVTGHKSLPPYEEPVIMGVPAVNYQYQATTPPTPSATLASHRSGSGIGIGWPAYKGQDGNLYYHAPTPLNDLGHLPALVECPYCGARGKTQTSLTSGNMNHAWACCAFFPTVIFTFIPYMISGLKNVEHKCQSCQKRLAVWHRSGHTQVK